jgi:hypothetical protein
MFITIGSHAIKHWFPDFKRTPYDLDQVSVDVTSRKHLHEINPLPVLFEYCSEPIASPDILLTVKISHAFWDIKWYKTVSDIQFLQNKGVKHDPELLNELYKHWENKYGKKTVPKFNVSKAEFFKKHVERVVDHDFIHEVVAYRDKPMFKYILKEGQEVLLDYNKFLQLDFESKLQLAREEIYSIAIERYLLTNLAKTKLGAYKQATKLVVTKLSKGWFPKFILTNYNYLSNPDIDYYKKFTSIYKDILSNNPLST